MADGLDGVEVVRALPEPNAATNGRATEGHAADTTTTHACCGPESDLTNVTISSQDHHTHTTTTATTTTPPTADRDGDGESTSMPGGSDEARAAAALERMLPATEAERQAEGLDFTFNDTTCRPKHRHIPIVYDGVFSSDRACQTDLSESGDVKKMMKEHHALRALIQTARHDLASFAALCKVSHDQLARQARRDATDEMKRLIVGEKLRAGRALAAAVRVTEIEAEQDREVYRAEMENNMTTRVALLEAENAASVSAVTKRASTLATQVLNLQRVNQALKDPRSIPKGANAAVLLDGDERDYDDLEDVTSMRRKLGDAEAQVQALALEVQQANETAQRAATRARMVMTRATQMSQQHDRERRTLKAEMTRLEEQVERLQQQLYSGPGDLSELKADITRQLKGELMELAAVEAKRQGLREKKRLQELHLKHEAGAKAEADKAAKTAADVEQRFQLKIAGLQTKHAKEINTVEHRWKRKFEVVEGARNSLNNKGSLNAILVAQARIKEHAAAVKRYSVVDSADVDEVDSFLPPLNNLGSNH